jgi:hypothetical protein
LEMYAISESSDLYVFNYFSWMEVIIWL